VSFTKQTIYILKLIYYNYCQFWHFLNVSFFIPLCLNCIFIFCCLICL
jgi:hypothetical protein